MAIRNTREWRVRLVLWVGSGVLVFASSGMVRFMLPLFPIGLACASAGLSYAVSKGWCRTYRLSVASIVLFGAMGTVGLAFYAAPAMLAGIGLRTREAYLESRAPGYKISRIIDETVAASGSNGKVLVFFPHVYYLNSLYMLGDPGASWLVDPDRLNTPADMLALLRKENISYVVRTPAYPRAIAVPMEQLEKDGVLLPYSSTTVDDFRGNRIAGNRQELAVIILKAPTKAP